MRQRGKSGLFLLELILAIGLFAFSAAVCLQLFAHAHLTVEQASDLNQAVLEARSAAACYQASQGDLELVAAQMDGWVTEGQAVVDYDGNWSPVAQTATYRLTVTLDGQEATIVVTKADAPIYTLQIAEGYGV